MQSWGQREMLDEKRNVWGDKKKVFKTTYLEQGQDIPAKMLVKCLFP